MALEVGTYISDLVATNPTASDPKSQGDDHLRLVKSTVKATFPNITGAVTATHTQLNTVPTKADLASPAFTGTPTAPTASLGTSSTQLATTAFVANTAFSSALPAQTGNAGKYVTTNGTTASWATLTVSGTGGTTSTGNVTLTASSAATLTITPTAPGLYVTLPDATTCTKADNLFSVYNAGDYDYGVKDNAGTQLGWIRPRTGAMIGLSDNATTAGTWAYYGLEKLGITASYINMTATNTNGSPLVRIALDANRTCFLFGGSSCYAVVYDASTQTWGSATLVRSGISSGAYIGVLSATNQVLVCTNDTTTGMQTVTLTIATNTVTVNTPVSTTLVSNWAAYGQLVTVGSSFVLGYQRASASIIRAITVSGTVPSIGAEANLSPTASVPVVYVSGSIVRTVSINISGFLQSIPYTVSGTTLTAGASATCLAGILGAVFRSFLNGNGNIVCQFILSGGSPVNKAAIFKLTGTTETVSDATLGVVPTAIISNSDYVQVTASKTAFLSGASGTWACNILTDTAGAASAGTQITGTSSGTPTFAQLPSTGNNATFAMAENGPVYSSRTFDCSGSSPVASSSVKIVFNTSSPISGLQSTTIYGVRNGVTLIAGQGAYSLGSSPFNAGYFSANLVDAKTVRPPIASATVSVGETGSIGYVNAWPTAETTIGALIQKIEAAA